MADSLTEAQRSHVMSRVRNKNTGRELAVRSELHRMGYRFRLHRRDLPGTPDIVLPRHHKIILVHGCFWHSHDCPRGQRPSSRTEFWNAKLDGNVKRDRRNRAALEELGWKVLTVWGCEVAEPSSLRAKLLQFMESD